MASAHHRPLAATHNSVTSATALLTVFEEAVTAPVCSGLRAGSETPVLQWVGVGAPAVLTNTTFALLGAVFMFWRLRGGRRFVRSRGSRDVCQWGVFGWRFLPPSLQPGLLPHPRLLHLTRRFFLLCRFLVPRETGTRGHTDGKSSSPSIALQFKRTSPSTSPEFFKELALSCVVFVKLDEFS